MQLGIKWRVLGAVCGWIPFLNLFMLSKIIRLASAVCGECDELYQYRPGDDTTVAVMRIICLLYTSRCV